MLSSQLQRPTRRLQVAYITQQSASLYAEWYEPPSGKDNRAKNTTRPIVFLHGLLGNARNVKTMAKKLCDMTGAPGLLMDLTGHGRSSIHSTVGSVTFDRVCSDIHVTLEEQWEKRQLLSSGLTFVGHSLGGRLALQYASEQRFPACHSLWLLDTVPGQPDESVLGVLNAAELVTERYTWRSRLELTIALTEVYELPTAIAEWLASQYDIAQQRFAFDLRAAHSIAEDFGSQDFWLQLDGLLDQRTPVHLVQGGANKAWTKTSEAVDERIAQYDTFKTHVLPKAGHWVHVDDLPGLLGAFKSESDW